MSDAATSDRTNSPSGAPACAAVAAPSGRAPASRPASSERALRRYLGWCRRRGRHAEAAARALELGYHCMWQARFASARAAAGEANREATDAGWFDGQVASLLLGAWVAFFAERRDHAEELFRQAHSASTYGAAPPVRHACAAALARCLVERHATADARHLMADVPDEAAATPDRLPLAPCGCGLLALDVRARLAVLAGDADAVVDYRRWAGRWPGPDRGPERAWLALTEHCLASAVGDAAGAAQACARGLRAARRMRGGAMATELHLAHASALLQHGRHAEARRSLARLARAAGALAAGPADRIEVLRTELDRRRGPRDAVRPVVHLDATEVLHILRVCADHDGDTETLAAVCAALKSSLAASRVAVFVRGAGSTAVAAAGCRASAVPGVADQIESGRSSSAFDLAVSRSATAIIRCGGEVCGALWARWARPDPDRHAAALALLQSAAAAIGPVVRALLAPRDAGANRSILDEFVGSSAAAEALRLDVRRAALVPFPVVVEGESGSGKELVARAIHQLSARRARRFCALNCAALPDELAEAELFGHARGAFTGAAGERAGLFEEADGGTLLLDEVGELSLRAQAKLLRVIQEGEVRRIGENHHRRVDPRIVAASNRPLARLVDEQRFRHDLLFRLDVLRISVPPLRERPEDVPALARRIWAMAADRAGSRAELTPAVLAALGRYHWPGNVRELQNVLCALAAAAPKSGRIGIDRLPPGLAVLREGPGRPVTLEAGRREFERSFVREALVRAEWHRARAASQLGVTRQGLSKLMARLGVEDALGPVSRAPAGVQTSARSA